MKEIIQKKVLLRIEGIVLFGNLAVPENPKGIVLFSHGSGSSRHSPRNRHVAEVLHEKGMATLLVDLLTPMEDAISKARFDIKLLTSRLMGITSWVRKTPGFETLPIGYFGASTGAASALSAAAHLENKIAAVVSRGGRPDLAMADLPTVTAPTLLIVGSLDKQVIELNIEAFGKLHCPKKLEIVQGASHLFEEQGKLDEVASLAALWFEKYLAPKTETVS